MHKVYPIVDSLQPTASQLIAIETKVLNDCFLQEAELRAIPFEVTKSSPLALRAFAEKEWKAGRLVSARNAIGDSMKAFAEQHFPQQLSITIAELALINLQTGQLQESKALLHYLFEQASNENEDLHGFVFFALACGAYLIGEESRKEEYFTASLQWFADSGRPDLFFEVWISKYFRAGKQLNMTEWEESLLYFKQAAVLQPQWQPYYLLACALHSYYNRQWKQVIELLARLREDRFLAYYHKVWITLFTVKARLEAGIPADTDPWSEMAIYVSAYEADLLLQFDIHSTFVQLLLKSNQRVQAVKFYPKLKAIYSQCGFPHQKEFLSRLEKVVEAELEQDSPDIKRWTVQLFGGLKFRCDDKAVEQMHWKRKKASELLIFLLLQPEFSAPKEMVFEHIFPNIHPSKMSNQLYVIVHELKQNLKKYLDLEDVLTTRNNYLGLNPSIISEVDVERYKNLLRTADQLWITERGTAIELYSEAFALYEDLLPNVHYLDWLETYRVEYQEKQIALLKKLVQYSLERDQFDRAEHYCLNWIHIRPLQEEPYQALLLLLMKTNRREEAISWYKRMGKIFHEELGISPSFETKRLIH